MGKSILRHSQTETQAWSNVVTQKNINRPNANDYIASLFPDFLELHGDQYYADDRAIRCGVSFFEGKAVTVIAQIRGKTMRENERVHYAMAHPEGFRKALRQAKQAEKFRRPVFCMADTPGAFCGVQAEERGQFSAIAHCLQEFMLLRVPVISVVLGSGGSGGALALCAANRLAMLEQSFYSVISPRGCASILWKNADYEKRAANHLGITPDDLLSYEICDEIIPETGSEGELSLQVVTDHLRFYFSRSLCELEGKSGEELVKARYQRYRRFDGRYQYGKSVIL